MKRLWLIALVLLTGCQKILLGEAPSDSPEEVFEILWEDFDRHYALFEARGVDWDKMYAFYRPMVTSETTSDELWLILCAMLNCFEDAHVSISMPEYPYYYHNSGNWGHKGDFIPETVDGMLSYPAIALNPFVKWGEVRERQIGYIYVSSFLDENYPIDDIDKAVSSVAASRAIIIDVRDNGGGLTSYPWRLSSWFSDNTRNVHYTQTRNGPGPGDFSAPQEHRNFVQENNLSATPVILLTNNTTVSAAERFTLSMKTFANVTHIGTTTAGAYGAGSMTRLLPNGWVYRYTIEKVTLPDGTSPEGIGCVPDVIVENDPERWYEDNVMQAALDYLQTNYGI